MATIYSFGNSEGTRRCDAKCYNADHPDCDCICGGRNHGAGLNKAIEKNKEQFKEIFEECKKKFGEGVFKQYEIQQEMEFIK